MRALPERVHRITFYQRRLNFTQSATRSTLYASVAHSGFNTTIQVSIACVHRIMILQSTNLKKLNTLSTSLLPARVHANRK